MTAEEARYLNNVLRLNAFLEAYAAACEAKDPDKAARVRWLRISTVFGMRV